MLKSIFSNWLAMAVTGAVSFFLIPVIIHGLGDFRYGLWVLVGSILDYGGLLDLGIRATLHRYVARFKGANEREALQATTSTALAIGWASSGAAILLTAVAVAALPILLKVPLGARAESRWLILLLGVSLAALFPTRILGACLCGIHRFDLYNLVAVSTVLLRAVLIVFALQKGFGLLGVAAATVASSLVWLVLNWVVLTRSDPDMQFDWNKASVSRARELSGYGLFAFLGNAGDYLRLYTDSAVIGRTLGIALVTPFSVVSRLMEYFRMTLIGAVGPLMPRMSEIDGKNHHDELRELFLQSTKYTALLSFFLGSLLILNGKVFLQFWLGPRFLASYPLLVILTLGYTVDLAQYPSNVALYAKGRHKPLALWTLAEGAANLGLSIVLAYKLGLAGVAWGTVIPMFVTKLLIQPWYTLRVLKLSALDYWRSSLGRPIALCVGFLLFCQTPLAPPAFDGFSGLIFAASWQSALFGLLAWRFGLSPSERHQFRQRLQWSGVVQAVRT